ncbi:hypothetical protein M011DRAFT_477331 [Sporormia fimetaria CBS 119925]|uniref:Translation machinery associated TMA7 n=1 Tax=Sporormia fimetaria CBS 119925 TaxID=1340428 RepID=A0A6A6VC10_9PLEO|nr:hypothetical protein M011DRAFT_477331 [Sporormia fimetaria CBS 119925]
MPSGMGTGTKPIHNKKPKKKQVDEDEDDVEFKRKQMEAKKKERELADSLKGKKGPINTGSQGIKKSGKK